MLLLKSSTIREEAVVSTQSTGGLMGETSPLAGYSAAIISTLGYAFYQVMYRRYCVDPRRPYSGQDACLFLGLVALWNFLALWPLYLLWNAFGIEQVEEPSRLALMYLLFLAFLDAAQNILMLLTIINSSPLFASVGMLLTLPTAGAFDALLYGYWLPFIGWLGVTLVVMGFAMLHMAEVPPPSAAPQSLRFLFMKTDTTTVLPTTTK
eukprot:TRINITY_DN196_c0_g1_i1.p1 TRINITY_DN196_c0_g1~~TRINITY_DN196_c0_g1_i1.p1  ORF type:complete len:208 (-),score=62.45 TRINITY_DN196_c0_g1_i1:63-686(-)